MLRKSLCLLAPLLLSLIVFGCGEDKKDPTSPSVQTDEVVVSSQPAGAAISLNGVSTGQVTPITLEDVPAGTYTLRLSLDGFNDYLQVIVYDGGSLTVNAVLTEPVPPLPVFVVTLPAHESEYDTNVIQLQGRVEMEMPDGSIIDYDDDFVILTLNGVDQQVSVDGAGEFSTPIGILDGQNALRLRGTSQNGDTGYSGLITVSGDFTADDIVIILSWNTPTSDIDMHVWNPLGEHCFYGEQEITEGSLDIDDTEGFGPETFTAKNAINGTYTLKINSYDLDEDTFADAGVTVILNGGQPQIFGPHHFITDDGNEDLPAAWWDVTVFTMDNGESGVSFAKTDPERIAKIQRSMENLPPK